MELVRVQDSDYQKTYELYMSFPENENGYMNNVYSILISYRQTPMRSCRSLQFR